MERKCYLASHPPNRGARKPISSRFSEFRWTPALNSDRMHGWCALRSAGSVVEGEMRMRRVMVCLAGLFSALLSLQGVASSEIYVSRQTGIIGGIARHNGDLYASRNNNIARHNVATGATAQVLIQL